MRSGGVPSTEVLASPMRKAQRLMTAGRLPSMGCMKLRALQKSGGCCSSRLVVFEDSCLARLAAFLRCLLSAAACSAASRCFHICSHTTSASCPGDPALVPRPDVTSLTGKMLMQKIRPAASSRMMYLNAGRLSKGLCSTCKASKRGSR